MATQIKRIPENRNTTRTSVTISGPAYMVAVGGSPRGAKAKPRKNTITNSQLPIAEYRNVPPRYLRPSTGSCHDRCKHGMTDDTPELKRPTRRLGSRKMPVVKTRGKRTADPLDGKKISKTTPKHSSNPMYRAPTQPAKVNKRELSKKVGASRHNLPSKRMATNHVKTKPISAERVSPKPRNHKLVSRQKDQTKMTKEKLKQLIAKKVQEMTKMGFLDAETAKFVTPTFKMIESLTALTAEATNLHNSESSHSSSEEQVSKSDAEHADNEDVECEDNYQMETSEDNEDGGIEVKFRRGRVLELEYEDNGPKKLTFRRGRVLDNGEDNDSEKVTLKHQEQEEKEAQELLNRVIEETATKLAEDMKTKVGALVGAFETVISLQPSSDEKETEV
uniref:Muscle M-line assembly protein unc-89 isoform X2 n=1 Tax=Tanacetum cinerariifolium TaxID=118510 RepID=A0A6L2N6T4_TANCI|nr:muscle M-line assembly protein unc-89 isoform X2 [Tanacetum cinerariifolium]